MVRMTGSDGMMYSMVERVFYNVMFRWSALVREIIFVLGSI